MEYRVSWEGRQTASFKTYTLEGFFTRWVSGADSDPFGSYTDFKKAVEHFGGRAKKDGENIVISNLNGTTYTLEPSESGITEGPVGDLSDGE